MAPAPVWTEWLSFIGPHHCDDLHPGLRRVRDYDDSHGSCRGASDATIELYARDAARLVAALGDDPEGWEPAAIRCVVTANGGASWLSERSQAR